MRRHLWAVSRAVLPRRHVLQLQPGADGPWGDGVRRAEAEGARPARSRGSAPRIHSAWTPSVRDSAPATGGIGAAPWDGSRGKLSLRRLCSRCARRLGSSGGQPAIMCGNRATPRPLSKAAPPRPHRLRARLPTDARARKVGTGACPTPPAASALASCQRSSRRRGPADEPGGRRGPADPSEGAARAWVPASDRARRGPRRSNEERRGARGPRERPPGGAGVPANPSEEAARGVGVPRATEPGGVRGPAIEARKRSGGEGSRERPSQAGRGVPADASEEAARRRGPARDRARRGAGSPPIKRGGRGGHGGMGPRPATAARQTFPPALVLTMRTSAGVRWRAASNHVRQPGNASTIVESGAAAPTPPAGTFRLTPARARSHWRLPRRHRGRRA